MYECIVVQTESHQVLEAEGPLDGAWESQQDPYGPNSDSWSMSVGAVSDASESHGSVSVGGSPVSAAVMSSPRTGPGSPMGDVEDT